MPSDSGRPYLSEVIDYDCDIEPYQFIKIYAGVGSGKNVFVDNLVKGNVFKHSDGTFVGKKHVLLVTSRRAKVNEQLKVKGTKYDKKIGAFDQLEYYFEDDAVCEYETSEKYLLPDLGGLCSREISLRSCCCTNAQVETACSEYAPKEPFTHPWERFDFIVIDEVHAILADANYQSAPFYVQRLLEEIQERSPKCKVIVMTGSPDIIRNYPLFEDYHLVDKIDVCDNLAPETVTFISRGKAEVLLKQCVAENKKAVCFFNRIDEIAGLAKRLSVGDAKCIAPSFSNEEKRRRLKKENPTLFNVMEKAEACLAKESRLPEEIVLFLTNARNKEGINIKNEDVKTMFVQAHAEVDIKQMVGRVRNGVDNLYIVVDSPSFDDPDLPGELDFTKNSNLLETINTRLESLAEEAGCVFDDGETVYTSDRLVNYVGFVHEKFPYVRFDYFKNRFVFYEQRQHSKAYYAAQDAVFDSYCATMEFEELAETWFPDAQYVVRYGNDDRNQAIVDEYIESHNLLEKRLTKSDAEVIFRDLLEATSEPYGKLGNLLRCYGYRKTPTGKSAIGDWYLQRSQEGTKLK